MDPFIEKLRNHLQAGLPGQDAQYLMAPLHRERIAPSLLNAEKYRPSAVLALFCGDRNGNWFIPLIERPSYPGAHSAQISFPGGKYDDTDGDLEHTAIRECYEEIGVKNITVLGKLTPLHIPVSGFLVHPFVAVSNVPEPVMKSHEREVKSILHLTLEDLMNDSIISEGTIEIRSDLKIKSPWFNVQGHRVWGATAMILSELKAVLKLIA